MNKKIKKILDRWNLVADNKLTHIDLTRKQMKILGDYITNLQEENKILKENAIHNDKVVDKAKWNEMIYKSRINKALKIIEEKRGYYDIPDELEEILRGEDNV